MKMLLATGYDNAMVPPKMRELMKGKTFPRNRIGEVVEYVESTAIKVDTLDEKVLKEHPNQLYCIKGNKYFFYSPDDYGIISRLSICEVNTSRPWRLCNYDNAEYIEYLDYKIVDKEFNMAELV